MATQQEAPRRVVLITGLSGAGRATALKALEDQGFEAVDNMPLSLLADLLRPQPQARISHLALGLDVRTRDFASDTFLAELARLRGRDDIAAELVFLDCDSEVLLRRFTETRRRHPLAVDRPVVDGIVEERRMLAPLQDAADQVIDTSQLGPHDLKRLLSGRFAGDGAPGLRLVVVSFSYRRGLPREADLVFDARFLANPHYVPALKPLSGRDRAVAEYVEADPDFAAFLNGIKSLVGPLLPRYEKEGKSYLTVAVGCTGGRHRSVFVAETLAQWLARLGKSVTLAHRDLGADAASDGTLSKDAMSNSESESLGVVG
ncbi:MAG: RNase adapter RapZ [Reyranellaceae bacterium]